MRREQGPGTSEGSRSSIVFWDLPRFFLFLVITFLFCFLFTSHVVCLCFLYFWGGITSISLIYPRQRLSTVFLFLFAIYFSFLLQVLLSIARIVLWIWVRASDFAFAGGKEFLC
ncbi:hypothetical protein MANES_18G120051v8 [Manihot esculenta]|uniref:Uncharacterized protein n=1 Tax=Manihot esculenta TaxID=3983 RepID=A0ACB7G053_MANES|nr:hypothetical protein MANES_18G120051v8 [Manihot esculenta]